MPDLHISYRYPHSAEMALESALSELQSKNGGQRHPWSHQCGAIDLSTILEVTIGFSVASLVKPILGEYSKGLFSGDSAKKLGEKHRKVLISTLGSAWELIRKLAASLEGAIRLISISLVEKRAISLIVQTELHQTAFVLNPSAAGEELFKKLPEGILNFLIISALKQLPNEPNMSQFWFDNTTSQWRFVFVPTFTQRHVDRLLDLVSGETIGLGSASDFVEKFSIIREDECKLILNPFAERWND